MSGMLVITIKERPTVEHIERVIRGDWHWVTAILRAVAHANLAIFSDPEQPHATIGKESTLLVRGDNNKAIQIKYTERDGSTLADEPIQIVCTARDGSTLITADCKSAADAAQVRSLLDQVETIAEDARSILRHSEKVTVDDAIEWYYRSRARGRKTTLKQAAQRYGFNESYVRQAKIEYDKAGKWGAKSKVKPENT